ncbi:MAG: hypothetical protein NTZ95_01170 [Candidatus Omnitrophica bacterium]|nr:hypothetical protein [Candidatus Omnitrophota bacterium]
MDKRGFALVMTLPILLLVIFLCTTLLAICSNDIFLAYAKCNAMRAYCIADAGIADGYKHLRDGGWTPSLLSFSKNYNVNGANDAGSYAVSYQVLASGTWPTYGITSIGTYKGVSKTLQLTVQLTSFQHWAYITNTEICYYPGWEGYASYWVTGNIVNGPLQVNDHLYVAGNPIFNGAVSVADTQVSYYDSPGVDQPQFNAGLWLGVQPVPLPDPAPLLTAIKTAASQPGSGLLIDGRNMNDPQNPQPGYYRGPGGTHTDTSIQFLANGTMNVTNNNQYKTTTNMPIPQNGAIYVTGGEVDVKGALNGQVTVGCDQNIWTSDSIIYHDTSPSAPNPASTDVLGLVAKTNVIFPNDLGSGNKEVDAYIVALNGSFYLENMTAVPGVLGNLVQYGGVMAQWSATVFGCFSGSGALQFGYLQIPYYDDRLTSLIPPSFTPAQDSGGLRYRKISLKQL